MQQLKPNALLQGGKYKIVRFLSSGGFGNTYEGVHTMMDTRVAIKELFPKMFCTRDENTSHVFQMNHPNIVRVLSICYWTCSVQRLH